MPKTIWYLGLLLLVLAGSAWAEDIQVRLETSKTSYAVGEDIEINIYLGQEGTLFPYQILSPNLLLSISGPTTVDLSAIRGSDGNIYPSGSIQAKRWPISLTPAAQIQVIGPATLGEVDTKKQLLAMVTLPAKAAANDLSFSIHSGSKISKPDGKAEYTLKLIATAPITITGGGASCDANNLNLCSEADCQSKRFYWYNNQCYTSCPTGTTIQGSTCVTSAALPPPSAVCGNSITESGEACDDGNDVDTDGCKNDCTLPPAVVPPPGEDQTEQPVCGNNKIDGDEDCDDGNSENTDACRNDCINNACGDGFVRTGIEACDDGNTVDNDRCTNDCVIIPSPPGDKTAAICGNNMMEEGEACEGNVGCHNCEYVEVGYKLENCVPISESCVVVKMAPRKLLKERLDALLDAQCYPSAEHPQKEFCEGGSFEIDYGRFNVQQKIKFIGKVASALQAYFVEAVAPS